ncbi:hypothetical protein [Algoriphagus algorifonticola]|uniref:hypothetical protein n=1 Tax=Algoriphagus algorifonticola TaxID=2593007 RepID=UPI0011A904F8|nr:hypothetical protein [Algoriphagus algorifonticola]
MKIKSFLTSLFFLLSMLTAWSQESSVLPNDLPFETDVEKSLWEKSLSESDYLALFRAVHAENEMHAQKWEEHISTLDKKFEKKGKSLKFIRTLFEKSHQNLFKTYEQHATFNQMLSEGKFDCVSGTATLGMILNKYGFDFEIVETDYHVFLIVNVDQNPIILESTLRIGGMITNPGEVKNYLKAYAPEEASSYLDLRQRIGSPNQSESEKTIFRKINLTQLAGLQYYNDAILHFNEQSYRVAAVQLEKAYKLYESERIEGLKNLAIDQAYKNLGIDLRK